MHDVFVGKGRRVLGFMHDFALIAGTRCNQRTGIQNRIAAEVRHFFNQNGGISVQLRPNRCSHSAGAGTDNDNSCFVADINVGSGFLNRSFVELARCTAGRFDCVGGGSLNSHGS